MRDNVPRSIYLASLCTGMNQLKWGVIAISVSGSSTVWVFRMLIAAKKDNRMCPSRMSGAVLGKRDMRALPPSQEIALECSSEVVCATECAPHRRNVGLETIRSVPHGMALGCNNLASVLDELHPIIEMPQHHEDFACGTVYPYFSLLDAIYHDVSASFGHR